MKPWFSMLMKNYLAVTLYPLGIYVQKNISVKDLNHEKIHWYQQKEMLCIFFYLWYIIEWLIKLIPYKGNSYYNISFEREAYSNESDERYLKNRKKFTWIKYIKVNKV